MRLHTDGFTQLRQNSVMTHTGAGKGRLQQDVPMSRYCSWRAGGHVKQFYEPQDLEDLCRFIAELPDDEPLLWLGLGSNLLVRDGGFDGTVIATTGVLGESRQRDDHSVHVEAGVPCPRVARFCAGHELTGAEFMVGIPGTLGGALAMNAGAFGGETWDIVESVETVDRAGIRHIRERDHFEIGYRHVHSDTEEWFLAADLRLEHDSDHRAREKMSGWLQQRAETQPMGKATCGSVFRNPPKDYAARLIETCGLKGYCIGNACVSDKHANFIINNGEASATDIEALIRKIQQVVKDEQGVELQTEVCIVGEQ